MTIFYSADFETTVNPNKTEVWLACFVNCLNYNDFECFKVQSNIKDFFKELYIDMALEYDKSQENDFICFFHNLKFDGSFILNFFLENDIECDYFINDMGVWYSITVDFGNFKLTIRDSLKILNFSIRQIAKLFKMPISKGETPLLYDKPNEIKKSWLTYIKTDVGILARGIYAMYFEENFSKFTSASESLSEFKRILKKEGQEFRQLFPELKKDIDNFCRKAYRGGWTFVNPKYQGYDIDSDIDIYDINSMYPSTMLNYKLPYGKPKIYEGYKAPKDDTVTIHHIRATFDIKKGYLPTIQIKNKLDCLKLGVRSADYVYSSNNEVIDLYLTNYDLDLFIEHYDTTIQHVLTLEFNAKKGIFTPYISIYREKKENAKTPGEKQKAKIMLNSLYGKFGAKIISRQKIAYLEDEILRFKADIEEDVNPIYVPIAVFVTSISRKFIIDNAQQNYDNFIYADTDSLHLLHSDKLHLDVDPKEFGKWAYEGKAIKGKYLRAKLYIERLIMAESDSFLMLTDDVKGAGMTPEIKKQVTFNNFKIGQSFNGKKASKQIKGGVLIYDTDFTIKNSDYLL